jgi:hypothetical protein
MRAILFLCLLALPTLPALASGKVHVISFGKWQWVKVEGTGELAAAQIRVRSLSVDGKVKEYTAGQPHDVTDSVFVVARLLRVNDALPEEKQPRWTWQPAGWIQIDRSSGRITPLKLPDFDPPSSAASWYRNYVAYCGSEDDTRAYAIVLQLGSRKPILRKALEATSPSLPGDPLCHPPTWERHPIRVQFKVANGTNMTFTIRNRAVELNPAEEDSE